MKNEQIPFHRAYITDEEIDGVVEAVRSGWLTMGPKTVEFEQRFREAVCSGAPQPVDRWNAVSFTSATVAFHLALKAIGLRAGDEVILPTNTFIAKARNGGVQSAARRSSKRAAVSMEALITDRTPAVIPVHFGGQLWAGSGISVLPERPQEISSAVRELDGAARVSMGRNGRAFALQRHDYRVLAKRFTSVIPDARGGHDGN